uniref:ARAD1D08492p n=1 Tax=Blastobotrys adeninivorans TaxID=409370 RepID=A0A060T8N0_BLAAD
MGKVDQVDKAESKVDKGATQAPAKDVKNGSSDKPQANSPLVYLWYLSHICVLVGSFLVVASYVVFQSSSRFARICYRLTFFFATIAYGLSTFKKVGGRHSHKDRPSLYMVLQFPTAQYAFLAVTWLWSTPHLFKLPPFIVYSLLQSVGFTAEKVLGGEKGSKIDQSLCKVAPQLELIVGQSNIVLFLRLVLDVILLRTGSGMSLLIYIFYYRLAIEQYSVRVALYKLENAVDDIMNKPSIPKKLRFYWGQFKWAIDHYERRSLSPEEESRMAEKKRQERAQFDRAHEEALRKQKEQAQAKKLKEEKELKNRKTFNVPENFLLDDKPADNE